MFKASHNGHTRGELVGNFSFLLQLTKGFIANHSLLRFCPDCQHASLLELLQENLKLFEATFKKQSASAKRKERLAFVSLSLSNIIPKSGPRAPGEPLK